MADPLPVDPPEPIEPPVPPKGKKPASTPERVSQEIADLQKSLDFKDKELREAQTRSSEFEKSNQQLTGERDVLARRMDELKKKLREFNPAKDFFEFLGFGDE